MKNSISSFGQFALNRTEMKIVGGGGQCGYQQVVEQSIWNSYTNSWSTVSSTYWKTAPYDSNGISQKNAIALAGQNGTHWCCDSCNWNKFV